MSTVPEAIAARHAGLRVAAVSCITNAAAGRRRGPLTHEAVTQAGERASPEAAALIGEFVRLHARL
jgi:purine-nucleoside phosphorylase